RPQEWTGFILPITVLVAVGVVAKANYSLWVAISKGQERFEPVSIATVISGVIMLALVVLATVFHAGLIAFVGIFTISCLT
ncbi:hypothetical protein, partial [Salmonella enterica]